MDVAVGFFCSFCDNDLTSLLYNEVLRRIPLHKLVLNTYVKQ